MYPTQNVYFLKKHNKKKGQVCLDRKVYQDALIVSFTATPPEITPDTHIGEKISSTSSNTRKSFPAKLRSSDGNEGVKTKICQKVLLQLSVCELHIGMLKNMLLGFT